MSALLKFNGDNHLYVLSNNHVIGDCNHAEKNAIIIMPAHMDSRRVASLVPLESGNPDFVEACEVDAALGVVTYPNRVTSWQGTVSEGYDFLAQVMPLAPNMRVKKIGRTTGLTYGIVEAQTTDCTKLTYKADGFIAPVYFKDFWYVLEDNGRPFAIEGDSG